MARELFIRDKVPVIKIYRLHSPAAYPVDIYISISERRRIRNEINLRGEQRKEGRKREIERERVSGLKEAEGLFSDNKDER